MCLFSLVYCCQRHLKSFQRDFSSRFLSRCCKFRSCLHLKIIKRQTGETVFSTKAAEATLSCPGGFTGSITARRGHCPRSADTTQTTALTICLADGENRSQRGPPAPGEDQRGTKSHLLRAQLPPVGAKSATPQPGRRGRTGAEPAGSALPFLAFQARIPEDSGGLQLKSRRASPTQTRSKERTRSRPRERHRTETRTALVGNLPLPLRHAAAGRAPAAGNANAAQ